MRARGPQLIAFLRSLCARYGANYPTCNLRGLK